MGAAFDPLGWLSGAAADVYFWRDAGQGDRRDGGNSVSPGGAGDCDPRRQSTFRQSPEEIREAASRTSTPIEEAADVAAAIEHGANLGPAGCRGGYYRIDIHCRRGDATARSAHLTSSAICEDTDYRDGQRDGTRLRRPPSATNSDPRRQPIPGTTDGSAACVRISSSIRSSGSYTVVLGIISIPVSLFGNKGRILHGFARFWSWLIMKTICLAHESDRAGKDRHFEAPRLRGQSRFRARYSGAVRVSAFRVPHCVQERIAGVSDCGVAPEAVGANLCGPAEPGAHRSAASARR